MINVLNIGIINIGIIEVVDFGNLIWFLINKYVYFVIRLIVKVFKNFVFIFLVIIFLIRFGIIVNLLVIENFINVVIIGNINFNVVFLNLFKLCNNLIILLVFFVYLVFYIFGIL